ncbi:HIRAN domain-containing protein [Lentilitoribacter sp. EG35]|uniref:HIRAN domain-containing protein n=1 Tax=Lentilitoribacter sp. EG35 TaxID=3234192 RepID=UPI003460B062
MFGLFKKTPILATNRDFKVNIVGESFYQDSLQIIWKRTNKDDRPKAKLVPDPKNPHDANAVKIEVMGMHIGFLSKEDAIRYHAEFGPKSSQCNIRIYGGFNDDSSTNISAKLNCKRPFQLA